MKLVDRLRRVVPFRTPQSASPSTPGAWFRQRTARSLQRAQRRLIERLLDAKAGPQLARHDAYCRLASWLPPPSAGDRVLELGCGPGKYVALLNTLGYSVSNVKIAGRINS